MAIVAALQMPDVDMEKGIAIVIATAKADISVELIIVDLKGLVDPLMRMTTAVSIQKQIFVRVRFSQKRMKMRAQTAPTQQNLKN